MKAKHYIKIMLNDEIGRAKKQIRLIKKDIYNIEGMRAEIDKMTEKEVLETVLKDEQMKKNYEELCKKLKDKNDEAIKKMIREGKIKEIK